jgi:hypothetical protein
MSNSAIFTDFKELIYKERLQYQVCIILSLVVAAITGILYYPYNFIFQRFIGSINPLVASIFIVLSGFILLSFLLYKSWLAGAVVSVH